MIEQHGKSLKTDTFPAISDLLRDGKTIYLNDKQLPLALRLFFNATLGGKAALVAPVHVGGKAFGLFGFVWGKESVFEDHDIALVEGIADQIGTALERDQLSAEVMRLKSELHQRSSEIIGQAPAIRRAIELALNVADTNTTVLVQGESGTGKELLANLIHYNSGPREQAVCKDKLRRDSRNAARIRAFRPRKRRVSPTRARSGRDASKRPTAARFSWTRSARCRCRRRSDCCAFCRTAN